MQTIFYTTAVILVILIIFYLHRHGIPKITSQLTHNLIQKRYNIKRNEHIKLHLDVKKQYFKSNLIKGSLISIMLTIIMAFVLYNYIFFAVPVSDSMYPTFESGDLILMQKYNTMPHKGDIIMFGIAFLGQGSQVVTHRVYSVTPDGIQTKGDATPIDNWIIPQRQIHAKAVIINEKPIVLKSIGHYFLNTQLSSTYASEFGFFQFIFKEGKRFGLLIFATCIIIFGLFTVNDSIKHRKLRRRN